MLVALHARKGEEAFNEAAETLVFLSDGAQILLLPLRRKFELAQQRVDEHLGAGERGLEFVADGADAAYV